MTESKSSMVTRDILYLTIDTFLDIVVKSNFLLLFVGWYLFRVVSGNRYLPRGSNEKTLCITGTDNTSGNHTALGFGHDSLNSLNSEKVIYTRENSNDFSLANEKNEAADVLAMFLSNQMTL